MKKIMVFILAMLAFGLVGCNFLPEEPITTQAVDLENYFNISSVEDLKAMEMYQSYQLTNDIDLSGEEWIPIGTFDQPFRGNFNGNGYTISNLTITENHMGYNGLFGHVEGNISDLNLTGIDINIDDDFLINVGGLVGVTFGSVNQVTVDGSITVSSETGNIYAGLLAGQAMTDLQEVFVDDVFMPNEVSMNQVNGAITTTSTQINYLGGLVGKSHNIMIHDNLVDTVTFDVDGGASVFLGGLVGHQFLYDFETIDDTLNFSKVLFYNNIVDATFNVENVLALSNGGLVGYNQNTYVENNFVKAQYDLDVTQLALGLLIGESWLSNIDKNVALIDQYSIVSETSLIGSIVGSQQTEQGVIDGFYVNQTSIQFDENNSLGTLVTLLDIQGDSFYQTNFTDLDPLLIDEVQALLTE